MLTISAHKGTARSWQKSPRYRMITRRRSSWQALSGSTAAEPNPTPREIQARFWRPSWRKTAADNITPHTARRGRGGLQREVKHERQRSCLGSTEEKALLTRSEREREDPHQLLVSDRCRWKRDQFIVQISI